MDRRHFLQWSSALALTPLLVRKSWAEGMADMPGMDHAAMGHGAGDVASMPAADSLGLPRGLPLSSLSRLQNHGGAGRLVGQLAAAPVKLPLLPGKPATTFWAYNGQIPGPAIVAWEGDAVSLQFTNQLSQPSTIHWHGMPVPATQDGNPHDPVLPGQTRDYQFRLPADSAASYWYHPHPHGYTGQQAYMGLAGVFVVKSRHDPLAHLPEQWLVLSDLKLDAQGQIAANGAADQHDGREGQFVLINGGWQPVIGLAEGERQRWRIWNACSARILKLALPAHDVQLVGTDGGLIATPRGIDTLLLSPGERAEIVITGRFAAGKASALQALPYHRGKAMGPEQSTTLTLATISRTGSKATAELPTTLRPIAGLGAPAVKRVVEFSENMADPSAMFLINGKKFDMNRVDFSGKVGQVEEWDIVSQAHMDHPFHIHGTQFQVLARTDDGVWQDEPFLAWRDVVNIPAGETVRLRFVQHLPGLRMFHCHILEHEDAGMMATLDVQA
ncbi:multicopper oxidase family protein [Aquitalea aquatica]|uniref:Multicopper oxidase family protein n=1 Tax=Aquitalea aquatica TaxID=3044273 RepID=A0A838YAE5_9NEIS|nr:multicopper oxidase family protein [Aquitalea magnusonii]MBA4710808.1 multicopper oxidase family protein [Aquitalea magnusonii]